MTLQQRMQRYYEAHGYRQISVESRTTMLCKYAGTHTRYIFIGTAGTVRTANQAHITESRGMLAPAIIRQRMHAWEITHGLED